MPVLDSDVSALMIEVLLVQSPFGYTYENRDLVNSIQERSGR